MSAQDFKPLSKKRLLIVLGITTLCLFIIFLPMLFEQFPKEIYLKSLPSQPDFAVSDKSNFSDFKIDPSPDEQSVAAAWLIQAQSFKNLSEAQSLVKQLRKEHLPAYLMQLDEDRYWVNVGPEISRTQLARWQRIVEQYVPNAQQVPYTPGQP